MIHGGWVGVVVVTGTITGPITVLFARNYQLGQLMGTVETILVVGAVAVAVPFVLYLSAKLVTYGILSGRAKFLQDQKRGSGNGKGSI